MARLRELSATINRLFHRDRDIPPERIPPANIPNELAELPERLAYSAPGHSRTAQGSPPEMTFLKLGPPDELYPRVFGLCNCSPDGSTSTPAIRLSHIPDKRPDEHIILQPVTLTTIGILYNSEISDRDWFPMFQRGLELPEITPEPTYEVVENWERELDDTTREQLTIRLS